MARITYKQFKKHLEKSQYYTGHEIRHLFNAVKQMDQESRQWVIEWIENGTYPNKAVEQVTVEELVKDFGYKPLNAFIAVDWLKNDPKAAKYFIVKTLDAIADAEENRTQQNQTAAENRDTDSSVVGLDTRNTGDIIEA